MAITEFEPINGFTNQPEVAAPEVDERPPFEIFKEGLYEMVNGIESQGQSALSSLLAIREELRDRGKILMSESLRLDQIYKESSYENAEISEAICANSNEQIIVFHKREWLEGFIRDRQR